MSNNLQVIGSGVATRLHEFIDGMRDCRNGVAHQAGKSKEYDDGYAAQYELEQIINEQSKIKR